MKGRRGHSPYSAANSRAAATSATLVGSERQSVAKSIQHDDPSAADPARSLHSPRPSWYRRLNPLNRGPVPPVPAERTVCPEHKAGFFSRLTFSWLTPIMAAGYRRPLETNDIWLVNPDRGLASLSLKFNAAFTNRVRGRHSAPLAAALHDTFKREFWIGGACVVVASICQVMVPFILRYLLDYVEKAYYAAEDDDGEIDGPPLSRGLGLVLAILAMQMMQSTGTNHFMYRGFMVGAQCRGVLVAAIFDKTLTISSRARAGTTPDQTRTSEEERQRLATGFFGGEKDPSTGGIKLPSHPHTPAPVPKGGYNNGRIMNLMSTDTARIDNAANMFHLAWTAPIAILLALAILLVNLTYSAVTGFSLVLFGIPALILAVKSLMSRREQINVITDQRVSWTQEVLRSIRFVKYHAWEPAFLDRLRTLRKTETAMVAKLLTTKNAINAISVSLPIFAAMLSFIVYSVTGHSLKAAPVFSSLALFNALRVPFTLLPIVISQCGDARESMKRIQDFLLAEDHQDGIIWDNNAEYGVDVRDANFTWEKASGLEDEEEGKTGKKGKKAEKRPRSADSANQPPFGMQGVNLSVGRGELLAIIGSVGSGKTSLLSALAGEMRKTRGSFVMGGSRAFCPQDAWIQNTTLRDNILFGNEMRPEWYERVVGACSLKADIERMPAGEDTEIGERGVNVSGGQRQRMSLARAIYSDSDIVIMDDPLSAVDAHVGRHMFEQAICGLLKGRCRILATHQLHVLDRCDRILWLEEGRIKTIDTYDNLIKHDSDFRALLVSTMSENGAEKSKLQRQPTVKAKQEQQSQTEEGGDKKEQGTLTSEEDRAEGSVPWSVYKAYIRASGYLFFGLIPIILLVMAQGANTLTSLWLSWWTSKRFDISRRQYIGIYVALGLLQAMLIFAFSAAVSLLGARASRTMLDQATTKVIAAPQSFHDAQPLGRLVNRFSKDVDVMDNELPDALRMFLYTLAIILSVFALLIFYFHWFAVALGPLAFLFLLATAYYRASGRHIKRHEAVLRGVLFSRFSESVSGISSIRAYAAQPRFAQVVRDSVDNMNAAYYLTFANQRWLATRVDIVASAVVLTVGLLVVLMRDEVDPSTSGVVLSYVLSIVQMMQLLVRQLAEVENAMNSTERLHSFGDAVTPEERTNNPCTSPCCAVTEPPPSWPHAGAIALNSVSMRYRPDLPLVLRDLTLSITGGERIAIVGRTGAGKSSITSALFRLVSPLAAGTITIDGLDISRVPLRTLRSRLGIIPQDPTLFAGTVRSNLDPFLQHPDLALWRALGQAGLQSTNVRLDDPVEEEGANFSAGQRQMLALARALVRDARIVVCDEATSSVDLETDRRIQAAMADAFRGKTVVTIAHRLRTVLGFDRVVVMDRGSIAEVGPPVELWRRGGIFRGMCDKSGIEKSDFEWAREEMARGMAAGAGDEAAEARADDGVVRRPPRARGRDERVRWSRQLTMGEAGGQTANLHELLDGVFRTGWRI
ncbi:abc transporter family protein [Diplodia corticola]|uniref:Abc transporter family protein n=1 Tax=Diplodia corticola TaxID=236234 RepID=A0A1J9RIX4_9PEZI|nr:abc transporter family protein [Diplodia corticola]OJD32507.1 abc transporter family protein [Diplodia corticola]